jgi:hypothetical protein
MASLSTLLRDGEAAKIDFSPGPMAFQIKKYADKICKYYK